MNQTQEVDIREAAIDVGAEHDSLLAATRGAGACVVFTGAVRGEGGLGALDALELEHYPGMAEDSIAGVIAEARDRWSVGAVRVIHRVGRLAPGELIVFVGVASAHRAEAFAAAEFVMDYLKTRAPIWKKEIGPGAERWVECRDRDAERAARWAPAQTSTGESA
jgi:molybdopterin synthase catalytic subunit